MTGDSALRIIATNEAGDVRGVMREVGKKARAAARKVALAPAEQRNAALLAMADALRARRPQILAANAQDLIDGKAAGLVAVASGNAVTVVAATGRSWEVVVTETPLPARAESCGKPAKAATELTGAPA